MLRYLALLGVLCVAASVRYDGFHKINVSPINTQHQLEQILSYRQYEASRQVIFLDDSVVRKSKGMTLIVHPSLVSGFVADMENSGMQVNTLNTNVQASIDAEKQQLAVSKEAYYRQKRNTARVGPPTTFFTYDEVNTYLTNVSNDDAAITMHSMGTSHEGRNINYVVINEGNTSLPTVWVDATIHAREWISSSVALWILYQLHTSSDTNIQSFRNSYRWVIAPILNPDGYIFTGSDDRYWRKNRNPDDGLACTGVDLNRNWDFNFGGPGTSGDPCSDVYRGPSAFSEPENQRVRDTINQRHGEAPLKLYIGMHSYTQLWLVNYAGTDIKPTDYDELMAAGQLATDAILNTHGEVYDLGTAPDILYVAAGGTYDWVKDVPGVKYSYTPELRPYNGHPLWDFVVPDTEIQPCGEEIFNGIMALLNGI